MRKFGVALVVGLIFATSACGGGGRPSADEVAKALQSGDGSQFGVNSSMSKKAADCMAKAFVASDLSDDALRAMIKKDTNYKPSAKDTKAISSIGFAEIGKCIGLGK